MLSAPLQTALFLVGDNEDQQPLRDAISACFVGGDAGYLAGLRDLDAPPLEFSTVPAQQPQELLAGAMHTLAVVLVTRALTDDAALVAWLSDLAVLIAPEDAEPSTHRLMLIDLDGSMRRLRRATQVLANIQALELASLGEPVARPVVAGLIALNLAMQALGSAAEPPGCNFFVSHAKLDGQPIARAMRHFIEELPTFSTFYDAIDIPPGSDFRRLLEDGVRDSVVIVLRSEIYETRVWCVQEIRWAESFGAPLVVVDLRHRLVKPASILRLETAPTVQVTDGNLYRILAVALQEALRARMHLRRVEAMTAARLLPAGAAAALVRSPTAEAMKGAAARFGGTGAQVLVYPDPALTEAEREAADAYAMTLGMRLTTPLTEAALAGSGRTL